MVTITVDPVNHAPTAVADAYSVAEDGSLTVPAAGVLANDSDVDPNTTLSAFLADDVSHGKLTLNADGSFVYTPNALYRGTDSFTYQAYDGSLASAKTTVTLTVTPVNHAPTANGDAYTLAEGSTFTAFGPSSVLARR